MAWSSTTNGSLGSCVRPASRASTGADTAAVRPGQATEEDLVQRNFTVPGVDRLWLTDITEHPTNEGKLYCAAVMDAYSRRIIGWSIAHHMRTELVIDALGTASGLRIGHDSSDR